MIYIGKTGETIDDADDEIQISATTADEAMRKLLGYCADQWPEADGSYDAMVWIEDQCGKILIKENVVIGADGIRE